MTTSCKFADSSRAGLLNKIFHSFFSQFEQQVTSGEVVHGCLLPVPITLFQKNIKAGLEIETSRLLKAGKLILRIFLNQHCLTAISAI